jgi:hypothetical protein
MSKSMKAMRVARRMSRSFSASGLRRSIAAVRLLNLMAIVVTVSIPAIYTFAADTPLLLEPHNLIVDHSLPKEEANTNVHSRHIGLWKSSLQNQPSQIRGVTVIDTCVIWTIVRLIRDGQPAGNRRCWSSSGNGCAIDKDLELA